MVRADRLRGFLEWPSACSNSQSIIHGCAALEGAIWNRIFLDIASMLLAEVVIELQTDRD